ncbi:MAG: signal peptidase II [Clostridia bacterium]|nr:signal peptidase II [Clostridia bacterium]
MIAWFCAVIVVVLSTDLITKFTIAGILNPGIAWGLGAQLPWLWIVVVVFSLVIVAVLIGWFMWMKKRTWWGTTGLALVIAGALGNAIDRLVSGGAVHDFIDFGFFRNNIADIALSIGAVLVCLALMIGETRAAR